MLFYKNTITYPEIIALITTAIIPSFRPATVQRYLLTSDPKQIKHAMTIAAVIHIPFYLIMFFFLLTVVRLEYFSPVALLELGNNSLSYNMNILVGLSLLAMIMSLAGSNLNTASICFVNDFINPLLPNISEKDKLTYARLSTIGFVLISYFISMAIDNEFYFLIFVKQLWIPLVVPGIIIALFKIHLSLMSVHLGGIIGIISSVCFNAYNNDKTLWISGAFLGTILNIFTLLMLNPQFIISYAKRIRLKDIYRNIEEVSSKFNKSIIF